MRTLRFRLALVFLATIASAGEPPIRGVDAVGLTVSDMDRSIDFYSRVLGFTPVRDVEVAGQSYEELLDVFPVRMRVVRLQLGREFLELTEFLTPKGRPAPSDARSNDRWFQHVAIVVRDMDRAYQWLRDQRVTQVSPEPQRLPDWNPNAGGIRAFYFRDPDGHPLELISFPQGKGASRWHEHADDVFLGIDHTAIAVGNTKKSLAFYRDRLGFRVAGTSENYGPEQERLNAVRGAHLRITSLRAGEGPGVEFLEYLAPRTGRSFPADERANDLVHWQVRLIASDGTTLDALAPVRAVTVAGQELGFVRALTIRDPDGHSLEVVEP